MEDEPARCFRFKDLPLRRSEEGSSSSSELYEFDPPDCVAKMRSIELELNSVRGQLSDKDEEAWGRHTNLTNASACIPRYLRYKYGAEMCTNAWIKFYEILVDFPLIPASSLEARFVSSFHLCEAPGAFVAALNHYCATLGLTAADQGGEQKVCVEGAETGAAQAQNGSDDSAQQEQPQEQEQEGKQEQEHDVSARALSLNWHASSLNPKHESTLDSGRWLITDDRFMQATRQHWLYGADGSGDILQARNIRHMWSSFNLSSHPSYPAHTHPTQLPPAHVGEASTNVCSSSSSNTNTCNNSSETCNSASKTNINNCDSNTTATTNSNSSNSSSSSDDPPPPPPYPCNCRRQHQLSRRLVQSGATSSAPQTGRADHCHWLPGRGRHLRPEALHPVPPRLPPPAAAAAGGVRVRNTGEAGGESGR